MYGVMIYVLVITLARVLKLKRSPKPRGLCVECSFAHIQYGASAKRDTFAPTAEECVRSCSTCSTAPTTTTVTRFRASCRSASCAPSRRPNEAWRGRSCPRLHRWRRRRLLRKPTVAGSGPAGTQVL